MSAAGDDPSIDFSDSSSAALIAVIMMIVLAEDFGFTAIVPVTENHPSRIAETVIVFGTAPDIDIAPPCVKSFGIFRCKSRSSAFDLGPCQYNSRAFFWYFDLFKMLPLPFVFIEPADFDFVADVSGVNFRRSRKQDVR